MRRFLLTTLAAGGLAAAAPAQFLPGYGRPQGYNFGYAPAGFGTGAGFNYGGFSFLYYQTRQFNYAYSNPFLGYSGAVNLQFNSYGARPPLGYGAAAPAYLYGGAGGYGYVPPAGGNPVVEEQKRLLAGARAGGPADANRLIADQAGFEFGRQMPKPTAPPAVDPALLDPSEGAVRSGEALNAVAAAIRPLAERRKGEPPLLPAEVLGHLRFDGPAAAEVVGLVRAGKLEFPAALQAPAFDGLRAAVDKPAAELVEAARDGRRADPPAADRLAFAVKTGRAEHADALRALGVDDALASNRFLAALDALAEAGRDGGLLGFYPSKWVAGATAAELLGQMDRLKLRFAPAGPDDADAYAAAHRGLVGYLVSLSTKK